MDYVVKNMFTTKVRRGVDVKLLQYDTHAKSISHKEIDIVNCIGQGLFKEPVNSNFVMINLEKDHKRYANTVNEFKKISVTDFIHLKGTWWKQKDILEKDLTFIVNFLGEFNKDIIPQSITINEFSEISDNNIHIQDGPLGCYCSHLRAMIYGYLNFEKYTVVIEDDISITNTENIETYLKQVPEDWDIVCIGAIGKNMIYEGGIYKFITDYHSTHFYIINNKCLPFLFSKLYPIYDQVDVIMSDQRDILNIYNIPETVYQKCISTNTQNNLHTIFTAKYYDVLREQINIMKDMILYFANVFIPDNYDRNVIICTNILYDVVYNYITTSEGEYVLIDENNRDDEDYVRELVNTEEYDTLFKSMAYFIECAKKDIHVKVIVGRLINDICGILQKFIMHKGDIKAYMYGATAQTYKQGDIIIKVYNEKLRWTVVGHNDSREIFQGEVELLKTGCGPELIDYDEKKRNIRMAYAGESLHDNFVLPEGWEFQIREIFRKFDENGIYYPEFKLNNILVLDEKITFVDYGLAVRNGETNGNNCDKCIEYLTILNDKFKTVTDNVKRYELYNTFMGNIKRRDLMGK